MNFAFKLAGLGHAENLADARTLLFAQGRMAALEPADLVCRHAPAEIIDIGQLRQIDRDGGELGQGRGCLRGVGRDWIQARRRSAPRSLPSPRPSSASFSISRCGSRST